MAIWIHEKDFKTALNIFKVCFNDGLALITERLSTKD